MIDPGILVLALLAAALAWRDRRIEFTETPFTEAIALFNRGNRVQLLGEADCL